MTLSIDATRDVNVVQNDTGKKNKKNDVKTVAVSVLNQLESKRMAWENTAFRSSNQQLYAVLAECYLFSGDLPLDQAKERSKQLTEFCKLRGYQIKNEAPLITRIVKAVFGNVDRRRISTYSLVLRSAKASNIQPNKLAEWIEEQGGIQEIKLARSSTYLSPKDKSDAAAKSLSQQKALALAKSDALSLLADGDNVGDECVLIAEQQADGSFAIKALTRSSTALTVALNAVYGQIKKSELSK